MEQSYKDEYKSNEPSQLMKKQDILIVKKTIERTRAAKIVEDI